MISAGIPSKGINQSLVATINRALESSGIKEIIVSINPGQGEARLLDQFIQNPRVTIVFQESDIGLYGNFRYLAQKSSEKYFIWYCTDDFHSRDFIESISSSEDSKLNFDLAIPEWEMREFYPDSNSWDENAFLGRMPTKHGELYSPIDIVNAEPSWIFGIWKRSCLLELYPKRNFDWLDTTLLQKVFLSGIVITSKVKEKTIVGTWKWANRRPNFVKGSTPNGIHAIMIQLGLMYRLLKYNPSTIKYACLRILTMLRETFTHE